MRLKDVARPGGTQLVHFLQEDERGRVLVADSMSYFDHRVRASDVLVCGSYAGAEIVDQLGLCWGPKALVAHACGVGKDNAGIGGLVLCDEFDIPMAAVDTMSAMISRGLSVYEDGTIGYVNLAAEKLGVVPGQSTRTACDLLLNAAPGTPFKGDSTSSEISVMLESGGGRVFAAWNALLLLDQAPLENDVVCLAMHSGKVMAEWASALSPKGVIANDGGFGNNNSGISGLQLLEERGIAAASVAAMSARINDPISTYCDGVISSANSIARSLGIFDGMAARDAAAKMLEQPATKLNP